MQTINTRNIGEIDGKARLVRLALIMGCSSLLLTLVITGAMITEIYDKYYKTFGYAITITGVFLIMVIIKNPKPQNVQRSREGSSASSQVIGNLPYATGPPSYSELLAEDLLSSQQSASGVVDSTAINLAPPKDEPVAPPPSYDIATGDSRFHIHSVSEVVPQRYHPESRRTSELQSSVFPTGGRGIEDGLPSYEDAVTWMVDQEEQSTHDQQNLIT